MHKESEGEMGELRDEGEDDGLAVYYMCVCARLCVCALGSMVAQSTKVTRILPLSLSTSLSTSLSHTHTHSLDLSLSRSLSPGQNLQGPVHESPECWEGSGGNKAPRHDAVAPIAA